MSYQPDAWNIVKLTNKGKVHYRVFAGWYGGYGGSDSWKMNSGITKVIDIGDFYEFYGESGSIYTCFKGSERLTGYMRSVLSNFMTQNTSELSIQPMDFNEFYLEFKAD